MQPLLPPELPALTEKGKATRARILECAAELIYTQGVQATNNEQLRRAAQVSGSQLNHYFPTKECLVVAVIQWQAEQVLTLHRSDRFDGFQSLGCFRAWADFYIAYEQSCIEGCRLGSLASEVIKTEFHVQEQLAAAFVEWRDVFRNGLEGMKREQLLEPAADATQLANLLLAAFQGGMLLVQIARDIAPLRDALRAAIDHVESYATAAHHADRG